jgi:signal transduction histidine kinase
VLHGGAVHVESAVGRGSTVVLTLPGTQLVE